MPLVVCLVLVTVVLHGSTIGWLPRRLGLAAASRNGILIEGASNWSTELAIQLKEMNMPVLVADSSAYNLSQVGAISARTGRGGLVVELCAAIGVADRAMLLEIAKKGVIYC